MKYFLYLSISGLFFFSCQNNPSETVGGATSNPHEYLPAPSFNLEGSDAEALVIADEVMKAQGGYANWLNTRYFSWNFFGARTLTWDKQTGDVRIEMNGTTDNTILININTGEGKAEKNGVPVTHPDSLAPFLQAGKEIWINDAYWVFMPFKLKDDGLTLKHLGTDTTQTGAAADVLELTFQEVGVTPQNKYHVFVDRTSRLVTQWAFFTRYDDPQPRFMTPWADYQKYGNLLLSGNRGQRAITDIKVMETVDDGTFSEL